MFVNQKFEDAEKIDAFVRDLGPVYQNQIKSLKTGETEIVYEKA